VSERDTLWSSPAIRLNGAAALRLAGIGAGDVAHVDLYSCFPSAVEIAAAELGLGLDEPDRPLTVTGGLTFAGGPGNNYVTHSIASMVDVLRGDPGSFGLVTANGWYITKHATGVYSTKPPADGFRSENVQPAVDRLPRREWVTQHDGPAEIEAYTVMHERDGSPGVALVGCLLDDRRRAWASSTDAGVLAAMTGSECVGRRARLSADGHVELA